MKKIAEPDINKIPYDPAVELVEERTTTIKVSLTQQQMEEIIREWFRKKANLLPDDKISVSGSTNWWATITYHNVEKQRIGEED